jgi:hypothetical protein
MAIALAKATNTPVLFTEAEIPLEVATPIKSADEAVVVELKRTTIAAIKPTGEQVLLAEVVTPPPAETQMAMARKLPKTASQLPLIALFGLLALGLALAVRVAEKRFQ